MSWWNWSKRVCISLTLLQRLKASIMYSISCSFRLILLVALFLGSTCSQPFNTTNLEKRAKTVPCDPISKYTSVYFEANMCKQPPKATCLFYTRGLSKSAKIFSKANGAAMTTIWELWPSSWYDKTQVKTNPLRCIMQDQAQRTFYFGGMSAKFAQSCDIFATVLDPNPSSVLLTGIWGTIEYPALRQANNYGGKVDVIEAISPDGSQIEQFWSRETDGKKHKRNNENTHHQMGILSNNSTYSQLVGELAEQMEKESHVALLRRDDACDAVGVDADTAGEFDEGGTSLNKQHF